jgi:sorbitol/mannitol transport system permease protein
MSYTNAATLPVYMSSFMTQEGLFWAKMSAAATLSILPVLILGWFTQKQLVRGLTMGAVKG